MNKEIILGIVRHILTAAGGVLVTKGFVDAAGLEQVIGGLVAGIGVVWSIASKK